MLLIIITSNFNSRHSQAAFLSFNPSRASRIKGKHFRFCIVHCDCKSISVSAHSTRRRVENKIRELNETLLLFNLTAEKKLFTLPSSSIKKSHRQMQLLCSMPECLVNRHSKGKNLGYCLIERFFFLFSAQREIVKTKKGFMHHMRHGASGIMLCAIFWCASMCVWVCACATPRKSAYSSINTQSNTCKRLLLLMAIQFTILQLFNALSRRGTPCQKVIIKVITAS